MVRFGVRFFWYLDASKCFNRHRQGLLQSWATMQPGSIGSSGVALLLAVVSSSMLYLAWSTCFFPSIFLGLDCPIKNPVGNFICVPFPGHNDQRTKVRRTIQQPTAILQWFHASRQCETDQTTHVQLSPDPKARPIVQFR